MPQDIISTFEQSLLDLYEANRPFLSEYQWEREDDRWGELLVCLMSAGVGVQPGLARYSVQILRAMGLASAVELSQANQEQQQFIRRVLLQVGLESESATKVTSVLVKVAGVVMVKWEGYIQRFLRDHGQRMVGELKDIFGDEIEIDKAIKVATLWLQNVANLPILLRADSDIQSFCAKAGISESQLLEISDRLGLNVAVIDDLIAYEKQRPSEVGQGQ